MSSKKRNNTECCERNVIHGVVLLANKNEFEYNSADDDLDEYVISIIENISKEESEQALLNTNVDQPTFDIYSSKNLEIDEEEPQKKAKVKKSKSKLMENLFLDDFF
ncbi:hypothetical protein ACOSQ2_017237 [Xanthoceras sorbifolium]